jgi:hypothetical protein
MSYKDDSELGGIGKPVKLSSSGAGHGQRNSQANYLGLAYRSLVHSPTLTNDGHVPLLLLFNPRIGHNYLKDEQCRAWDMV